jgi:hypothetical protein
MGRGMIEGYANKRHGKGIQKEGGNEVVKEIKEDKVINGGVGVMELL